MLQQSIAKLEELVSGKTNSVEIICKNSVVSREEIVENINSLVISWIPGCWVEGEFINKEDSDYLIYDLHLSGSSKIIFPSIRLLDFGDKFLVLRV